jgi:hypothetical protein
MFRYVATAAIAALMLAVALKSRGHDAAPAASPTGGARPDVRVEAGPHGRHVTVTHRLLGSVSRASLVYELNGQERTAARRTDCERLLDREASLEEQGFTTEVQLTGEVPYGASQVRLVLEAETGTTVLPVEVN